jgi:hypothetical protein
MKSVSKVILTSMMLLATMLYSCDKEIETSPVTVDLTRTATLEMYVYADLDQTNYGKEPVAAGVKVILTIPYSKLVAAGSKNWIDTVETDANGKIIASVPATSEPVTVTISPVDFVANQTQSLTASFTTIQKVFKKSTSQTVDLKAADHKIELVEYDTDKTFSDFDNFVTISGKAYAETDENNSVTENAPLVDVIFSSTGWSKKVTLVKTGAYTTFTVQVPNNLPISYTFDFTADKNVPDGGGWIKKLYRYNKINKSLGSYTNNTEGLVLDFETGTKVD